MNESKAMTDDVVWRLRERIGIPGRFGYSPDCQLLADAANEIERLRAPAPSVEHPFDRDMSKPGAATALARELAAPAPSAWQPDPVAYRWRFEGERSWTMTKYRPHDADRPDVICEPLYTSLPSSDRGGVG